MLSLLIIVPLLSFFASADVGHYIDQQWCTEGSFRIIVRSLEQRQVNKKSGCQSLSLTRTDLAREIHFDHPLTSPAGNSIDFVFKEIFADYGISYHDLPTDYSEDYVVKVGRCSNLGIFMVQNAVTPQTRSALVDGCSFEKEMNVSSLVDISGVYARQAGTSVESFLSDLTRRR